MNSLRQLTRHFDIMIRSLPVAIVSVCELLFELTLPVCAIPKKRVCNPLLSFSVHAKLTK